MQRMFIYVNKSESFEDIIGLTCQTEKETAENNGLFQNIAIQGDGCELLIV